MSLSRIALAVALLAAPALHAGTVTYHMTFTSGSHTGAATLTLASPPASSGVTSATVANQQLQHLSFTVANQTFDFSSDPSASARFINGQISKINFGQVAGQAPASYTLVLSNGFSLYGSDLARPLVSGSFNLTPSFVPGDNATTVPPPASPTPEPRTLILLVTALLAAGFLLFRRARAAHS